MHYLFLYFLQTIPHIGVPIAPSNWHLPLDWWNPFDYHWYLPTWHSFINWEDVLKWLKEVWIWLNMLREEKGLGTVIEAVGIILAGIVTVSGFVLSILFYILRLLLQLLLFILKNLWEVLDYHILLAQGKLQGSERLERLHTERVIRGWSGKKVATEANISPREYLRIEMKRVRKPYLPTLVSICKVFDPLSMEVLGLHIYLEKAIRAPAASNIEEIPLLPEGSIEISLLPDDKYKTRPLPESEIDEE